MRALLTSISIILFLSACESSIDGGAVVDANDEPEIPLTTSGRTIATSAVAARMPDRIDACYIPGPGTIYRVGAEGTPSDCRSKQHIRFSWDSGSEQFHSGWELVRQTVAVVDEFGTIRCPEGKMAVNGGRVGTPPPSFDEDYWLLPDAALHPDGNGMLIWHYTSEVEAWAVCIDR